jgi:hypothetical protein
MKPLLYIGATLMVGAGIYGFVDFKKKNHSREFQSLYKEESKKEAPKPANLASAPVADAVITEKKDTVAARKQEAKKEDKVFSPKQFSRAALKEEVLIEEIEADSLPEPAPAPEIKKEQ